MPKSVRHAPQPISLELIDPYMRGWQEANHAWQKWLDEYIPDWDAMSGIDLATLPKEPE